MKFNGTMLDDKERARLKSGFELVKAKMLTGEWWDVKKMSDAVGIENWETVSRYIRYTKDWAKEDGGFSFETRKPERGYVQHRLTVKRDTLFDF